MCRYKKLYNNWNCRYTTYNTNAMIVILTSTCDMYWVYLCNAICYIGYTSVESKYNQCVE